MPRRSERYPRHKHRGLKSLYISEKVDRSKSKQREFSGPHCVHALYSGHDFSRVPMSLRLTQGDENQVVLLKGTAFRPSITALQ
jgi:hypothetical protein